MNQNKKRPEGAVTPSDQIQKNTNNYIIPAYILFKNSNKKFAEFNCEISMKSIYDLDSQKILTGKDIHNFFEQLDIKKIEISYYV